MPFGLRNAAQTFQRYLDTALRGLTCCYGYIDDIIIASRDETQHRSHLKQVLERFRKYGLTINLTKSILGVTEVEFLGYLADQHGIRPIPQRIKVLQNYQRPKNRTELRRFLGVMNFYRRFILHAALTQAPLHALLKGARKKDHKSTHWTEETINVFEKTKNQLAEATLLLHPMENAPLTLTCDASDVAMGAALEQRINEKWQFFYRILFEEVITYTAKIQYIRPRVTLHILRS